MEIKKKMTAKVKKSIEEINTQKISQKVGQRDKRWTVGELRNKGWRLCPAPEAQQFQKERTTREKIVKKQYKTTPQN